MTRRCEISFWSRGAELPRIERISPSLRDAGALVARYAKSTSIALWEIHDPSSGHCAWGERVPEPLVRLYGKRWRLTANNRDRSLDLLWCDDGHGWYVGSTALEGDLCLWCLLDVERRLRELERTSRLLEEREMRRRLRRGE